MRCGRCGSGRKLAARLAIVIAPAEELFWRGMVQEGLMRRFGRWPGAAIRPVAYGGVHVVTGNFTLFGAAGVAGAQWCAMYAAGMPLGALVVSHVAWDVWIFLVQPTGETGLAAAGAADHPLQRIGSQGTSIRPRTALGA